MFKVKYTNTLPVIEQQISKAHSLINYVLSNFTIPYIEYIKLFDFAVKAVLF